MPQVTIPVRDKKPLCPCCGNRLILQGLAYLACITVDHEPGSQAPNQSKVFVHWQDTHMEDYPLNITCTSCAFQAPYHTVYFSGVT